MLPATPLHHLLLEAFGGPLVMTSGNRGGEPQVIDNDAARERLGGLAQGFVMHDRAIVNRLDDSVLALDEEGQVMPLRRARLCSVRHPCHLPICRPRWRWAANSRPASR
jgi:hydrogenase maturation protein HypF